MKSYRIKAEYIAKLMGVSVQFVRFGLQEKLFPWGYAVKMSSVYTYYINPVKFAEIEKIKIPVEMWEAEESREKEGAA